MDRHLIDYLPPVLRDVLEFQTINGANEPEFVLAWAAVQLLLDNQFLETATEHGVSVWEQELKIRPKNTDTLESRKARVKARWNLKLPYTVPWLKNWLTSICGDKKWTIQLEDYTLYVEVQTDVPELASEVVETLHKVKPANILYQPIVRTEDFTPTLYVGGHFTSYSVTELPLAVGMGIVTQYPVGALADENGLLLLDENGDILYEK